MRKTNFLAFAAAVAISLLGTACKDTKTLQENEQLKSQVAELQKENGQLGNDVESLTAARDALTQQNSALQAQLRKKHTATKTASRKHRRSRKSQQS